jgi:hypothetical protein
MVLEGYETFHGIGHKISRVGRLLPFARGWIDEGANFLHEKYGRDLRTHGYNTAEAVKEQSVRNGNYTKGSAGDPNLKYRVRN